VLNSHIDTLHFNAVTHNFLDLRADSVSVRVKKKGSVVVCWLGKIEGGGGEGKKIFLGTSQAKKEGEN